MTPPALSRIPDVIFAILECLGLETSPRRISPARSSAEGVRVRVREMRDRDAFEQRFRGEATACVLEDGGGGRCGLS